MEIKFDVKVTFKEMYQFMLYSAYSSFSGIFSIILGAVILFVGIKSLIDGSSSQPLVYVVFGVFFMVYMPISLYTKAKKQVLLNPMFKKPISYTLGDKGILTRQEDASSEINWEDLFKVVAYKGNLFVYTTKVRAFILPKVSMDGQSEDVVRIFREKMDPARVKIRH